MENKNKTSVWQKLKWIGQGFLSVSWIMIIAVVLISAKPTEPVKPKELKFITCYDFPTVEKFRTTWAKVGWLYKDLKIANVPYKLKADFTYYEYEVHSHTQYILILEK